MAAVMSSAVCAQFSVTKVIWNEHTLNFRYKEVLDILYSTNTIQLATGITLLNLHRLIPTQRLASITSIEVLCYFHGWGDVVPERGINADLQGFHSMITTYKQHLQD
jgi:hypothetical protein